MPGFQPQPRGYGAVDQSQRILGVYWRMTGHRIIGSLAGFARVGVVAAVCAIVAALEDCVKGRVCEWTKVRCWDDDYVRQPHGVVPMRARVICVLSDYCHG